MTTPVEKESSRKITYRIGWKKGRIRMPDGKGDMPEAAHPVLDWIWRPLPFLSSLPSRVMAAVLVLLPIIGFAAILWVVSMLARNRY